MPSNSFEVKFWKPRDFPSICDVQHSKWRSDSGEIMGWIGRKKDRFSAKISLFSSDKWMKHVTTPNKIDIFNYSGDLFRTFCIKYRHNTMLNAMLSATGSDFAWSVNNNIMHKSVTISHHCIGNCMLLGSAEHGGKELMNYSLCGKVGQRSDRVIKN